MFSKDILLSKPHFLFFKIGHKTEMIASNCFVSCQNFFSQSFFVDKLFSVPRRQFLQKLLCLLACKIKKKKSLKKLFIFSRNKMQGFFEVPEMHSLDGKDVRICLRLVNSPQNPFYTFRHGHNPIKN